ncbi:3966_t:CDS:1, partial [Gigaspora margarita]
SNHETEFISSFPRTGIIQNKYAQLNISEEYLAKDAKALLIHTDLVNDHIPQYL